MPDIQEAKCFEFTVSAPPLGAIWGWAKYFFALRANFASPPELFLYTPFYGI